MDWKGRQAGRQDQNHRRGGLYYTPKEGEKKLEHKRLRTDKQGVRGEGNRNKIIKGGFG